MDSIVTVPQGVRGRGSGHHGPCGSGGWCGGNSKGDVELCHGRSMPQHWGGSGHHCGCGGGGFRRGDGMGNMGKSISIGDRILNLQRGSSGESISATGKSSVGTINAAGSVSGCNMCDGEGIATVSGSIRIGAGDHMVDGGMGDAGTGVPLSNLMMGGWRVNTAASGRRG